MYDKINVMGEFGAEEASDNGRSLLDICKDTCIYMSVWNNYFKNKSLHDTQQVPI